MAEHQQSLRPRFEDVQHHYDLSDEFFQLFLDPTRTYSCAYFERDDMTLQEAQIAKIDLALGKLGLQPGMTLLDIGCGWGAASLRAVQRYDVNVTALTLSRNQQTYVERVLAGTGSTRRARVLLEGWERFHEPVDRIVAIGPLEHFGYDRYQEFFTRAYDLLPADGTMLLHCIVQSSKQDLAERNLPITMSLLRFFKFIADEIFPGGRLPLVAMIEEHAAMAGFTVSRVQPLQQHYARTLDLWAGALEARRDEAIAIQSPAVYDQYMRYLTGCADLFRDGYTNVCQFTLDKGSSAQR